MSRRRPVVGIVGHDYVVPRFFGDLPVSGIPTSYVDAVAAAGGRPVLLPSSHAVDLLDTVDGLVLAGGGDLSPALWGGPTAVPGPDGSLPDLDLDEAELAVARGAAAGGVPLLGVCRGLQVLAVAFGGTLVPDLGRAHVLPDAGHPVRCAPGSLVDRLVGDGAPVNSLHHQSVADPGPSWRATAWAADGVVEAIEWAGSARWPVLGVQWHPELRDPTGPAVFGWLVDAATGAPERRGRTLVRS